MPSIIAKGFVGAKRLDVWLSEQEGIESRAQAKRMILSGGVQVNQENRAISPSRSIRVGDEIQFELETKITSFLQAVAHDLEVVYEDDWVLVINKPAGMVVHPAAGHANDTLVNYLLHYTQLADQENERPGIVHRIDKDTSGLLVVAKDLKSHEALAVQFAEHTVERTYHAIVWGVPKEESGVLDSPIGRHPVNRKKFALRENGKRAVTRWKVLRDYRYLSLIECTLETGRTHQIRVHLAHLGHSLLGDPLYGRYRDFGNKLSPCLRKLLKEYEGQALHARTLGFKHPAQEKELRFSSELPEKMRLVMVALENEDNYN